MDFNDGKDQTNTGLNLDRPDLVPGAKLKRDNPNPNAWYTVQAPRFQAAGTFGNLGRNVLDAPGIFRIDFAPRRTSTSSRKEPLYSALRGYGRS